MFGLVLIGLGIENEPVADVADIIDEIPVGVVFAAVGINVFGDGAERERPAVALVPGSREAIGAVVGFFAGILQGQVRGEAAGAGDDRERVAVRVLTVVALHRGQVRDDLAGVAGSPPPISKGPMGSDKGRAIGEGGVSQVKRARRDDHFQALVAAHEIERLRADAARQKDGAEQLADRLHGRRFGAGSGFGIVGRGGRGLCGCRRGQDQAAAIDAIMAAHLQILLECKTAMFDLRLGGGKDHGRSQAREVAEQIGQQQDGQAGGRCPGKKPPTQSYSRRGVDALEIKEWAGEAGANSGSGDSGIHDSPSWARDDHSVENRHRERITYLCLRSPRAGVSSSTDKYTQEFLQMQEIWR